MNYIVIMRLISLIITVALLSSVVVGAENLQSPNTLLGQRLKAYPDSCEVDSLSQITLTLESPMKFGAFVYMPSLYRVNEDGSIGDEVSSCRMIEQSAIDRDTLRFRVLDPPARSGKYAVVIKSNSFSVKYGYDSDSYNVDTAAEGVSPRIYKTKGNFINHPVNLTGDSLRILHISNSYGGNQLYYIDDLLKAANVDANKVLIDRLMYSGASFKNWYDVEMDKNPNTYICFRMTGDRGANIKMWDGGKDDGTNFRKILKENTWDLIVLNQASSYAPYFKKWESAEDGGYLIELLDIIRKYQPETPVGFLLIHSYAYNSNSNAEHWLTAKRWEKICEGVGWIKNAYGIDFVVPYGTAIENLRLTKYNNAYDLTGDGIHLAGGLPQYAAGCCYFETVFSPRYNQTVYGNPLRVSDPEVQFSDKFENCLIPVDDAAAETAQKAAFLATHNMFEIRNPDLADLKDYVYGEPLNQNSYCFMFDVECGDVQDCAQRIPYRVVSSTGMLIGGSMSEDEWMQLPKGLYIRNGEKILKTD